MQVNTYESDYNSIILNLGTSSGVKVFELDPKEKQISEKEN